MPELPEVETLRRSLEPMLPGRTVASARVHRRAVVVAPGDPPGGWSRSGEDRRPTRLCSAMMLAGARIERLERLGKRLAVVAEDGRTIEVHLGMTGQLLIAAPGRGPTPRDHVHVRWRLDSGESLIFRDPRRFGGLWVYESERRMLEDSWSWLGPDALTIGAGELRERGAGAGSARAGSGRAIKAALLDQRVLAGVGNIYADEALFESRLAPQRLARDLERADWTRLARAIRLVLARAIAARGTTLRDYRDALGASGEAGRSLAVYGRRGEPCVRCGTILATAAVAQRTTCWCRRCQAG